VPETCLPYDEDLSALLDGELSAARAAELRAHRDVCPRCTAQFEALRRADERVRSALRAPVPEEDVRLARIEAQLRARLAQEAAVRAQPTRPLHAQAPRRRRTRWIVAAGMGLAAAAALGLTLLFQARTPVAPVPLPPPPVAQTPAPQEGPPAATPAPEAVAELPVVKPAPARLHAPATPAPPQPAERPLPSAPPEVDLASADEEDIELATRLDMLEDFEVIQKLDLLERLRKAEEGSGSG
jgi:anti-sigma factor RsiW